MPISGPLVATRSNADISNPNSFPSLVSDAYLKTFRTLIKLILVSLERSRCLVSRTLKKLKF